MPPNNQRLTSVGLQATLRPLVLGTAFLLVSAMPAAGGWDWHPLGIDSHSYSFNPPLQNGIACPGTVLSISASITDADTWNNGQVQSASLRVSVTCTLTGPGVNQSWSASGTDSAPPLPLSATATISAQYTLCTPGSYTLTWRYTESSPADDPNWPPLIFSFFTVGAPDVSVEMDDLDVVCCWDCTFPLDIRVTNNGDCPGEYDWELTAGSGDVLNPVHPFDPSSDTVAVPAHATVSLWAWINTNPNIPFEPTQEVTITLTNTDPCTPQSASTTATVSATGCEDTTPTEWSPVLITGIGNCYPDCRQVGESNPVTDSCGNTLKVTCKPDAAGVCSYEVWFNSTCVGKCVYLPANNRLEARWNETECRFLATRHMTYELGTGQGAPGVVDWQEYYWDDVTGTPGHACLQAPPPQNPPEWGQGQTSTCEYAWWE